MLSGSLLVSPEMDFSTFSNIQITLSLQSFGTIASHSDDIMIEHWNGTAWSQVGSNLHTTSSNANQIVNLPYSNVAAKIRITAPNSTASAGARLFSVDITGTPTSSCTSLAAPTVTPTAGNTQATLSWTAVPNASSYTLIWNGGSSETVTSPVTKTGLTNGTSYSYSVMAVGDGTTYCATNPTATGNVTPTAPAVAEPTNHATLFTAVANSGSQITLTWTDASGAISPAGYLVKASTTTPTAPADGTPEADAALVKNITQGTQTAVFTGLSASTAYNFSIWPYSNSGAAIDYKIGSHPTANATTETPLGVPVSTAASGISSTGFTANWDAAASATSYDVNVYTKTAGTFATDLFISEYGEGSSNNKYIEIYNGTGAPVNLSNYTIKQAVNGGGWDVDLSYTLPLTGTLANNDVYVIANSSANATVLAQTDLSIVYNATAQGGRVPAFTGNDAIGLFKNDVLIDVFGSPASTATIPVAGFSTYGIDHTIVRKSTVNAGNTNWTISSGTNTTDSEWTGYASDIWTYLGSHTMSGSATSTPISGSPFAVSGATSKTLTGLSAETTYYYTVVAKKGAESSVASNEISATTSVSTALNNGIAGAPFITTAKGKLTVSQLSANSTVRVYDATGRMVATKVSANGSIEIPLQVAGMYTVRIAAGVKNWTMKVVNSNL
jgi:uncharacterized membrane protein YccF (DUF307 family)